MQTHFLNLGQLMREKGHRIAFFSMNNDLNLKSKWSKYFVSKVSFHEKSILGKLKFGLRIIYSKEARKNIIKLLDDFKPEIIHLHDIHHQISLSILPEIAKRNIPVIQSLGSYHLISPNYSLFHNGVICEITKKNEYYKAIIHKCVKNSYLSSLLEVVEKYFHKVMGWDNNLINKFIVPSIFLKNKLIEFGLDKQKLLVIPHFVNNPSKVKNRTGNFILYFGRLSEEKGLLFLLEVMRYLPEINLKIVGEGILEEKLNEYIKAYHMKNIKLSGYKSGRELYQLIADCRFTILPSVWYEVFGISIIESFSMGKTVLAAKIGGIPEIIKNNINGILFAPDDVADCKSKISLLFNNDKLREKLNTNAYQDFQNHYSSEQYYSKILNLYNSIIN